MRRIEVYGLSPEQEAEIIAEMAFENEYNRLRWEGVDLSSDDDSCDLCAGLTFDHGEFDE